MPENICMTEGKGNEKVSAAKLKAFDDASAEARYDAKIARVEADEEVVRERRDDMAGKRKDVCLKDANAADVEARSDARAARTADEKQSRTCDRVAEVRRDAGADSREAPFEAALERCDSLAVSREVEESSRLLAWHMADDGVETAGDLPLMPAVRSSPSENDDGVRGIGAANERRYVSPFQTRWVPTATSPM